MSASSLPTGTVSGGSREERSFPTSDPERRDTGRPADRIEELERENTLLRARVEELEAERQELIDHYEFLLESRTATDGGTATGLRGDPPRRRESASNSTGSPLSRVAAVLSRLHRRVRGRSSGD